MSKPLPKSRTRRSATPTSPINFRMPEVLRRRLRSFAEDRHLAEAEALRLIVSEHLNEIEDARELAEAERWQFKQAYATFQAINRGEGKAAAPGEVQRIIADTLARRPSGGPA